MSAYKKVNGYGDTITCDNCNDIAGEWYLNDYHALCGNCVEKRES